MEQTLISGAFLVLALVWTWYSGRHGSYPFFLGGWITCALSAWSLIVAVHVPQFQRSVPLAIGVWVLAMLFLGYRLASQIVATCSDPKCDAVGIRPLLLTGVWIIFAWLPLALGAVLWGSVAKFRAVRLGRWFLTAAVAAYTLFYAFNSLKFFEHDEEMRLSERHGHPIPWEFIVPQ